MEPDDILADQVEIRRPELLKLVRRISVGIVADARDIVCQRVKPHIGDVAGREVDRNAPAEGGAGYAEILQPRQKEVVHHLVFAGLGLDKLRMRVDMLDQAVRVLAHLKEIRRFGRRFDVAAVQRALAVHKL